MVRKASMSCDAEASLFGRLRLGDGVFSLNLEVNYVGHVIGQQTLTLFFVSSLVTRISTWL